MALLFYRKFIAKCTNKLFIYTFFGFIGSHAKQILSYPSLVEHPKCTPLGRITVFSLKYYFMFIDKINAVC